MLRICALGLIMVLIAGCGSESFTEVEKERSPLINGFESYATREQVMEELPQGPDVKIVDDTSLAKNNSQPPYKLYTISIEPFKHLKHRGPLQLTFYKNRLEQSRFYPEQRKSYLEALDQVGLRLGFGQELARGNTVIWEGTDADQKQYVGWADKRLRAQQRWWLARYR